MRQRYLFQNKGENKTLFTMTRSKKQLQLYNGYSKTENVIY